MCPDDICPHMSKAIGEAVDLDTESVEPADAFAMLGNDHRMDILHALWARDSEPVAFSDLYRDVDLEDSAQFNYHLEKLTTHFVRRTDEGYALRRAGEKVVQAVLAGSFTQHPRREIAINDSCVRCDEELNAVYEDEVLAIECPSCGHGHGEYPFPPGGLNDRTDEEILAAFDQRVRHLHCLAKDGVCPECNGRMRTTIVEEGECCLGVSIRADHRCDQCAHELCSAPGLGILDSATAVAFYRDHGIDISSTPYWQLPWCVSDHEISIRSRDPWLLDIQLSAADEALTVTLDESLIVQSTTQTNQ